MVGVVSTYRVFSQTYDEPAHLASGMEWLSRGTYRYEAQHPPLTRILAAAGPFMRGVRTIGNRDQFTEGNLLLGSDAEYRARLALARFGELPFLILLCAVMWFWGRRLLGDAGGTLAVLFTATNPNILAHAGLATTDIGVTAAMAAAVHSYVVWTDERTPRNAALFGMWMALATVTKFSAIPFIGLTILLAEVWRFLLARRAARNWSIPPRQLLGAIGIGLVVLWAVYRFDVGPVNPGGMSVPAPALFRGLAMFVSHGTNGHPSFLLGGHSDTGWWYYFPVALAVKSPLPLLVFTVMGIATTVTAMRRGSFEAAVPLFAAAAVLAVGMAAKVDIGIRHILAIYPFLALLAARGALWLWNAAEGRRPARWTTAALAACSIFVAVHAQPDHLSYFNPLAGRHPERVLVDSNLDWGQDLYRLAEITTHLRGDSVRVAYFGSANISAVGVPRTRALYGNEPVTGWVAASETFLAGEWVGSAFRWLDPYKPVTRVGPSMVLYYIPPAK